MAPIFIMDVRRKQLHERSYYIRELKMLRGGKVLKVSRESLVGDRYVEWFEVN